MNIEELTIGQAKELSKLFGAQAPGLNAMVGKKCIVRTYSSGVWFGLVVEKSGNEVIVKNARRLWRWWAAQSISLSAVAVHGIIPEKSKIVAAVPSVWLEAIELIPASDESIQSIEDAKDVEPE